MLGALVLLCYNLLLLNFLSDSLIKQKLANSLAELRITLFPLDIHLILLQLHEALDLGYPIFLLACVVGPVRAARLVLSTTHILLPLDSMQ